MLTQEYLELIRMTGLYMLQQIPVKPSPPLPKKTTLEVKEPKLKQEPIKPSIKPIPEQPISNMQVTSTDEILKLLRIHCPKLKLVDPPNPKKSVIILFENETTVELKLLESMTSALKKQGYSASLISISAFDPIHLQNSSYVLVGSKDIFIRHAHLKVQAYIISSLMDLIENPSKRRVIWNELIALL